MIVITLDGGVDAFVAGPLVWDPVVATDAPQPETNVARIRISNGLDVEVKEGKGNDRNEGMFKLLLDGYE